MNPEEQLLGQDEPFSGISGSEPELQGEPIHPKPELPKKGDIPKPSDRVPLYAKIQDHINNMGLSKKDFRNIGLGLLISSGIAVGYGSLSSENNNTNPYEFNQPQAQEQVMEPVEPASQFNLWTTLSSSYENFTNDLTSTRDYVIDYSNSLEERLESEIKQNQENIPETYIHTVQRNENLWNIARNYISDNEIDLSIQELVDDIAYDNNLVNPNLIHTGDQLTIDLSELSVPEYNTTSNYLNRNVEPTTIETNHYFSHEGAIYSIDESDIVDDTHVYVNSIGEHNLVSIIDSELYYGGQSEVQQQIDQVQEQVDSSLYYSGSVDQIDLNPQQYTQNSDLYNQIDLNPDINRCVY